MMNGSLHIRLKSPCKWQKLKSTIDTEEFVVHWDADKKITFK